jgi:CubicO group peptidase (beta-lactamase class C family)
MRTFFTKSLALFFAIYCISDPLLAEQIIWRGTPLEQTENLLSGNLNITLKNGLAKGSIGGLTAQAVIDSQQRFELFFAAQGVSELVMGTGVFKGYLLNDGELRGHWVRPKLQKRSNVSYASPVHFLREFGVYRGVVTPLEDSLSIYFLGEQRTENRFGLTAFVPENNGGRYYSNAELLFEDDKAILTQVSRTGEKEVITGTYKSNFNSFRMSFLHWGGDFLFQKQSDDKLGLLAKNRNKPYSVPDQEYDGWPVGKSEEFGIDSKILQDFANMLSANPAQSAYQAQTEAFLLARNGVLIFEQYFRGYDSKIPHDLRSASKSLTGILPGLAEHAGWLNSTATLTRQIAVKRLLEENIYDALGVVPENPNKRAITLEHALSMSTGLDCDDNRRESPGNEEIMQNQQDDQDWFGYILGLEVLHKPGSHTAYCSGGINLAGAVVTAKTGVWIPALIEDLFARPLGISNYQINLMPDGKQGYSGGGLQLRARDFLKLGQLMLNKGSWKNSQLLAPTYVESALTPRGTMFSDQYALGWWVRTYEVDKRRYDVFYAGGNGGQQIIAVPELDMVAVFLGSAYGTRGSFTARDEWFPNIILRNAIISADL